MNCKIMAISFSLLLGFQGLCYSETNLISVKVDTAPIIDGKGQEAIWAQAQEITTYDRIADLDIAMKSVYTNEKLFFLVRYDDPEESRIHLI